MNEYKIFQWNQSFSIKKGFVLNEIIETIENKIIKEILGLLTRWNKINPKSNTITESRTDYWTNMPLLHKLPAIGYKIDPCK